MRFSMPVFWYGIHQHHSIGSRLSPVAAAFPALTPPPVQVSFRRSLRARQSFPSLAVERVTSGSLLPLRPSQHGPGPLTPPRAPDGSDPERLFPRLAVAACATLCSLGTSTSRAPRQSPSLPGEAGYDFSVAMTRGFLLLFGPYAFGFSGAVSPDATSRAQPFSRRRCQFETRNVDAAR